MIEEAFQVLPAVDLLGEEAVRLEQGDFGRVAARLEADELVRRFAAAGARMIHVVDLDGARRGLIRTDVISSLVEAAGPAKVQASGGIRSLADAERLLAAGAARVEVGGRCTAAGVSRILCTAIERDGMLGGPDLDLLREVRDASGLPVLAAGGIRSEADLAAVAAAGCEGAVVGRALLDGSLPLSAVGGRPPTSPGT